MNVISLEEIDSQATNASCDVCIVGAGAAGLYLADRLSRAGQRVVVLEAGPRVCLPGEAIGIEADCPVSEYRGVSEGRVFGLGGSTSSWGGVLIPFPEQDLRPASDFVGPVWRDILETVRQRSSSVAQNLGIRVNPSESIETIRGAEEIENSLHAINISLGAATWLPFRRRNFSYLVSQVDGKDSDSVIYLNAVACDWIAAGSEKNRARLRRVEARSIGGRTLSVNAEKFVIAAGAIESARIIKEIDLANGAGVVRSGAAVGNYLSDHLSCRIADVDKRSVAKSIEVFGPRFTNGCMQSFRFIESSPGPSCPRYFAHLIFENDNPGFDLARMCLQGLQARKVPKISASEVRSGAAGLVSLAFSRVVRSKLYIPRSSPVYMQMDIEQEARFENAVLLDNETDRYGRKRAIVCWEIGSRDRQNLVNAAKEFLGRWEQGRDFLPLLVSDIDSSATLKPYDVYHPVGTCRMGQDREAVVDDELLVHGTSNLFIVSTAVFPTAGSANPTFSMLCLADKLADHLQTKQTRSW